MHRSAITKRPSRPYHHGDLRNALLGAAERVLKRDGLGGLTLRAAAREAGVSHAAPAYHFQDLTGLLSELAAVGFNRLAERFEAAISAAGSDPRVRLDALGRTYVGFARAFPDLFLLMFRSERLDMTRPALREAAHAAFGALRQTAASQPEQGGQGTARAIAAWSLVHGFAMLLLDGRLRPVLAEMAGNDGVDELLEQVIAARIARQEQPAAIADYRPAPADPI